jgi:hypothetical protein
LLAHGRWFFPGTSASSTTKAGRHNITEILLKGALKHNKTNKQTKSNGSDVGIGATLRQEDKDLIDVPICYYS